MKEIQRYSPVSFKNSPVRTEKRDNWIVALEYEGEDAKAPFIIDLSHRTRFDIQSSALSSMMPFGITIPSVPGQSVFENGFLVNRMNPTQASFWHLSGKTPVIIPTKTVYDIPDDRESGPQTLVCKESAYTDVTEATMFIGLIGKEVFLIAEKLTSLDFLNPGQKLPFLLQGPICHVPCQVVTLNKKDETSGLLFTCSRGYGHVMINAFMEAGKEFGLRPAGEDFFSAWLKKL